MTLKTICKMIKKKRETCAELEELIEILENELHNTEHELFILENFIDQIENYQQPKNKTIKRRENEQRIIAHSGTRN